jgi:6-phosphofructokinase 1
LLERLAVLTSGGDAPGMNAAVRAVTRCATARGVAVAGIYDGYTGLIGGNLRPLGPRDVGGIIHLGGTFLGTTRCQSLMTDAGCIRAMACLEEHRIGALVVIGGEGSQSGAFELSRRGISVVGIASTIDNDLHGTDISIGATTAVDVALEAIDRLRVTASSMRRAFLVEVMGRHCGYIALTAGIGGGAETIAIPEIETDPEVVARELQDAYARGKSHAIGVIAEGAKYNAVQLAEYFAARRPHLDFDVRITTLGHTQRGGAPGAFDRILATTLGVAAVEAVADGAFGVLVGLINGRAARTPLAEVAGRARPVDSRLMEIARTLAT